MARVLAQLLDTLERTHGRVPAGGPVPTHRDPLAWVLWENVAYLVNDGRRARAFATLKKRIGVSASAIAGASDEDLLAISELGGMHPNARVAKLRKIAGIVLEHAGGDLAAAIRSGTPAQARRLLKRFPGIGDPGADKILLFAGVEPRVALDSNGLRVLQRLGVAQESKNYAASYRSAQAAADQQLPPKRGPRVRAYQLLRRHGQEVCKNNRPLCEECAIGGDCAYFRSRAHG